MTGRHDGGHLSSDGSGLLLREADGRIDLTPRLAGCFEDHRNAASVEHDVRALVAPRVHALALGHEDLNDHDALRRDAVLSLLSAGRHRGAALASPSTLNRLELGQPERPRDRYKRVVPHTQALDDPLVKLFMESCAEPPRELWLDLDATHDPLHGAQEGRFLHGYYRCYCCLPLSVFCGDHLPRARLRRANEGAGHEVYAPRPWQGFPAAHPEPVGPGSGRRRDQEQSGEEQRESYRGYHATGDASEDPRLGGDVVHPLFESGEALAVVSATGGFLAGVGHPVFRSASSPL